MQECHLISNVHSKNFLAEITFWNLTIHSKYRNGYRSIKKNMFDLSNNGTNEL